MTMWLRYWHKYSSGPSEPSWMELEQTVDVDRYLREEVIPDLKAEFEWSEQYRGIGYELYDEAPIEVLEEHYANACRNEAKWSERATELRRQIKEKGPA